jgi:hypothetical protein
MSNKQAKGKLPCGHNRGTFTDDGIEYCAVCDQAVDLDAFMQSNKVNAPVFGQLIGKGTILPNKPKK